MSKTLNIAHRGGAGLKPENTLAAFANALDLGVDGFELDVHVAKDGTVVVFHDDALKGEIVRDAAVEVRQPTLFGELIIMVVYLLMAAILLWRPQGLFGRT